MYVWILSEDRNVTKKGELPLEGDMKSFWAYSDFETARQEMCDLIKHHALSDNGLFDGNGNIIGLDEHIDDMMGDGEDFYEDEAEMIKSIPGKLSSYFMGDCNFSKEDFEGLELSDTLVDYFYDSENSMLYIYATAEGGCNGINPYIQINSFEMNDPKRCYTCRIRNQFNDYDEFYYVNIDLLRVKVDEKRE